jgi:hypothetical protein
MTIEIADLDDLQIITLFLIKIIDHTTNEIGRLNFGLE